MYFFTYQSLQPIKTDFAINGLFAVLFNISQPEVLIYFRLGIYQSPPLLLFFFLLIFYYPLGLTIIIIISIMIIVAVIKTFIGILLEPHSYTFRSASQVIKNKWMMWFHSIELGFYVCHCAMPTVEKKIACLSRNIFFVVVGFYFLLLLITCCSKIKCTNIQLLRKSSLSPDLRQDGPCCDCEVFNKLWFTAHWRRNTKVTLTTKQIKAMYISSANSIKMDALPLFLSRFDNVE